MSDVPIADPFWRHTNLYRFSFGPHGTYHVYAYGDCLDDALEDAAAYMADCEPDLFTDPEYEAVACELGIAWPPPDEIQLETVRQAAETDLTYTEAGWLRSWEWFVYEVTDPERREVDARARAIDDDEAAE